MSLKANGMSTLEIDVGDIRPVSVVFTANELVVTLADGRRIATPLAWYPRLRDANADGNSLAGARRRSRHCGDAERPVCGLITRA
jgi:hypothetical protein